MKFLGVVQGQVNGVSLPTAILEGDTNGQETKDRRVISSFLDNIKGPYFLSFFPSCYNKNFTVQWVL